MKLINRLNEKILLFATLFACFVFFCVLDFTSETTFDVGDGIRHYLISRYSWQHSNLFLDSWGKPFFTLVSSTFSQFGFLGITFFNIICGISSAFFTYGVAKKLGYKNSLLAIPFLLFAPVYFPTMNSGLTEPFFGFVLIASIYLVLEKKIFWASILVSFLPFVRTEGFLFLPLFFIYFAYNKSFVSALLLSFGTLTYSLIGLFYFGDFLWIKTKNPYNGANKEIYGHGEPLSFIYAHDFIWGTLLSAFLVLGILFIVFQLVVKNRQSLLKKSIPAFITVETVLIFSSFIVFFLAHSIMWWKGLANSMGLVRVFAGVIPLSTIICLKGVNTLSSSFLFKNTIVKTTALFILLFFVIIKPFRSDYFPFVYNKEQVVVKEAADWIKKEGYDKKKMYYLYPYLPLLLDIDAFDNSKASDLWGLYPSIKKEGIATIPDGTIVFWDAHFGPNECAIPLNKLIDDPNFDLLKSFYPKERFTTLGNQPFSISLFEKRKRPKSLSENLIEELAILPFDLNNVSDVFNKETEYGKSLKKQLNEFPKGTEKITFCATYLSEEVNSKDALVVMTVDKAPSENIFWDGKPLVITTDSAGVKHISVDFIIPPATFQDTDIFTIYVWNKDRKNFSLRENNIRCWGKKQ